MGAALGAVRRTNQGKPNSPKSDENLGRSSFREAFLRSVSGLSETSTSCIVIQSCDIQQYKLFEYVCPGCKKRRPIQYFYREGCFLEQNPDVVCGACNTATKPQEIFKTADFCCPKCKIYRRVRLPARPLPLTAYRQSIATCDTCFFRGEVPVGKHMVMVCGVCVGQVSRLTDIWAENGGSLTAYCEGCCKLTEGICLPSAQIARVFSGSVTPLSIVPTLDSEHIIHQNSASCVIFKGPSLSAPGVDSCSEDPGVTEIW